MITLLKKIKRKFRRITYNIVYSLNHKKKFKNYILFESNPDFSDSPRVVFDELIKRNVNEKYKLIWFVKDKRKFNDINIKNVFFVQRDKKLKNKLNALYYNFISKYIIDCNSCIKKLSKHQKRIYLTHGMIMKEVRSYFEEIGKVDYITVTSDFFVPITEDLYKVSKNNIAVTGLPRNDCFFIDNRELEEKIRQKFGENKFIVWLPTYRNHKNKKKDKVFNIKNDFKFGVPILDSKEMIESLNNLLKEEEICLYIKLHPSEDVSNIEKLNLSNITLINDDNLSELKCTLNEFIKYSIGIITDYSSVYYDYCITGNPIGLSISDIEEYTKHIKLIFDYKKEIKGEYLYNYQDLKEYILKAKKNNINPNNNNEYSKYNKYRDANATERVIKLMGIEVEKNA